MTIRDASDLLQLNYDSAKTIWATFKKEGRKYNKKVKRPLLPNTSQQQACAQTILGSFDHSSKQLQQCCKHSTEREASPLVKFNSKLMKHIKASARGKKYLPSECDFFRKLTDLRSRNDSLASKEPERNSTSLNKEERYIELHDCLFGQR